MKPQPTISQPMKALIAHLTNNSFPARRRRLNGRGTLTALLVLTASLLAGFHARADVSVRIESQYGATQVYPPVSASGQYTNGQQVIFSAPSDVYLDRYRNELDPTEENIRDKAFYRAHCTGLTLDGGAVELAGNNTFVETLTTNITVVWLWELDYAVILESATSEIDGLEPWLGNPTLNGSATTIDKHWVAANTLVSAAIDGIITPDNSTEQDTRYSTRGYTIENAPNQSDHFLRFDSALNLLDVEPVQLGFFTNFTIEFWARREPQQNGHEQEVIRFNNDQNAYSFKLLRVGFRASTDPDNPDGMFFSTNDSGGVVAEIPGTYVDDTWHHWAWTFDTSDNALRCYRDGNLIQEFAASDLAGPPNGVTNGVIYMLHESPPGSNITSVAEGLNQPVTGTGILTNFSLTPAGTNNFALDLTAFFRIDEADTYKFELSSDDGSILDLDGQELINADGTHDASQTFTKSIYLSAGLHNLRVGYFQGLGLKLLSVKWNPPNDSPDQGFVAIPNDALLSGNAITSVQIGNSPAQDRSFSGGLNNVRFWTKTLSQSNVVTALTTASYGTNTPGLAMEFTFDQPNLTNQVSDEGNNYVGQLVDFGSSDLAADFQGDYDKMHVPPVALPSAYTLESRMWFPPPPSAFNEHDTYSPSNQDHFLHINKVNGHLGLSLNGVFYQCSYSVTNLSGWHMISSVGGSSNTTFYVDGFRVGSVDAVLHEPVEYIGNHAANQLPGAGGLLG